MGPSDCCWILHISLSLPIGFASLDLLTSTATIAFRFSNIILLSQTFNTLCTCQGMTSFPIWSHLGVLPTPTSATFGILWTLTASQFQTHFRVLPTLSLFQQSATPLCAPSTTAPHLISPLKAAPRLPPLPKVVQRSLLIPHPLIWTPLWHSPDILRVAVEMEWPCGVWY